MGSVHARCIHGFLVLVAEKLVVGRILVRVNAASAVGGNALHGQSLPGHIEQLLFLLVTLLAARFVCGWQVLRQVTLNLGPLDYLWILH